MKTYRVIYRVDFDEDTGKYMTLTVKGETSVKDGTTYYYEDDDGNEVDGIVKNDDTARQYVYSLFADSEDNLVDIPKEFIEEGLDFDSHLQITNVISISK